MAINKVEYAGETLMDITDSTVEPASLMAGAVAYNAAGERIEGSMEKVVDYVVNITNPYDEETGNYNWDVPVFDKTIDEILQAHLDGKNVIGIYHYKDIWTDPGYGGGTTLRKLYLNSEHYMQNYDDEGNSYDRAIYFFGTINATQTILISDWEEWNNGVMTDEEKSCEWKNIASQRKYGSLTSGWTKPEGSSLWENSYFENKYPGKNLIICPNSATSMKDWADAGIYPSKTDNKLYATAQPYFINYNLIIL